MASLNDIDPNLISDDSAVTNSPQRTNDSSTNTGLLLDGSFTASLNEVNVCDHDESVQMAVATNDRFQQFITKTPTYYIKVNHDLNSHCSFNPGTGGGNDELDSSLANDDAWALTAVNINHDDVGVDVQEKFFPYGSTTVQAGEFTATDLTGRSETWTIDLAISLENDGAISSNASLSGVTQFWGLVNDDFQTAQEAYWPTDGANVPSVADSDGDILAAKLEKTTVESDMADSLAAAESDVNDVSNVVASWSISIDAVDFDATSNLTQYGKANNVNTQNDGTYTENLFNTGDMIVAATPQIYNVVLNTDSNGEVNLVNDYVYGIVIQN